MSKTDLSGNGIRKTFVDFFVEKHGHTFVQSAPLVPGGDATLLFTNAGMVQFKDVFLGTDIRPYTRAVNSQKCMRVAGKHNDLEDVGRDDTHHTFFEMLGNWSFGDYYKKEAIAWAWELLTEVWGLPKDRIWTTCFEDEKGEIPRDDEAANHWREQTEINPDHILFFGRKDNLWEMAEIGPCGPCSEIHLDRGIEYCNLRNQPDHRCEVNGDCQRFLELWNLVFIQYNRLGPSQLEPLPATHVDTGMGFERIVSVLQEVDSNYRTDLLMPLIEATQQITGQSDAEREADFTAYRVIADHTRAAAFLIADGVVPGNLGRNYVCRMIIRRGYRFGGKIGINEPFMARVAEPVIESYGGAYPELVRNRKAILDTIQREEEQFQRTLEKATGHLENLLNQLESSGKQVLAGDQAADLYTTYGMPLEITRDIAQERNLSVDEKGFLEAMELHRLASGGGKALGPLGGEDVEFYRDLRNQLVQSGKLDPDGVRYDPYGKVTFEGSLLGIVREGQVVESATPGDQVEIVLPETHFYIEAGGQVSDTGILAGADWKIRVDGMRKPAAGIFTHLGEVLSGEPETGDKVIAQVDVQRRQDIQRNHTATHLLHAALHKVLGNHARQAGSLVAPDRLRFDFTHPEAVTREELRAIEDEVNRRILEDHYLDIQFKPLQQALDEGAMALFGEKYADTVRNITIGGESLFSNELCGGTHVKSTGEIGTFLITSEGSAAAGIRRIEAVTGREAYRRIQESIQVLKQTAAILATTPEDIPEKTKTLLLALDDAHKKIANLRQAQTANDFSRILEATSQVGDIHLLTGVLPDANADMLRQMADRFRQRYPENGVAVLASVVDQRPLVIAAITKDLTKRGFKAGDLVQYVAKPLGGGGGGKSTLAQAGGKDPSKLDEALASVKVWLKERLK
jgi:alanyl-tRNA synthetase